jgi:hypothetical protein
MTAAPSGTIQARPAGDAALRLRYLDEVSGLLWPAPARAGFDVPGKAVSEYLLVLDAKRPRLLVPARHRRAAAAAVRRYAEPGAVKQRLLLRGLSAALRSGLGDAVLRPRFRVCVDDGAEGVQTIETYLRRALAGHATATNGQTKNTAANANVEDTAEGTAEGTVDGLVISLSIGPARANSKPVLQVLTRRGSTVGFAKVGVNDLTRALAMAEAESLRTLAAAAPRHVTVPAVLHQGRWNDLEVLILSPLPIWLPRARHSAARLRAAMLEVAEIGGVTAAPLRDSPYWARLGERLAALAASATGAGPGAVAESVAASATGAGPGAVAESVAASATGAGPADDTARALLEACERIGERAGGARLRYGCWHGDWTPWNMATLRDTLLVWDWERFERGVPLGFDAVHYAFQDAVVRDGTDPTIAVTRCLDAAAELLAPFDVAVDRVAARLTALLYFIDIAARYLADKQAEAGAQLGRPREWLLPVLTAQVERLCLD